MKKLILPMQTTTIGLKIFLFLFLFSMPGCRIFEIDDYGDYQFISYIKNGSNERLRIQICNGLSGHNMDTTIGVNSMLMYNAGPKVKEGDDVLAEFLFHDYYNESYIVKIYRSDSLLVQRIGPASYMGDSVHHFYNYDSWEVELVDNEYVLEFTIYESDIEK